MLQMTGQIVNTFTQDGGQNKDGEQYEARHKVQLLGESIYLTVILSTIW